MRDTGRKRRPLLDISSKAGNTPEEAWEALVQLIGDRQRGRVIVSDPRAHEALRLLGGKAAYDAVAATPERIRPRFVRVYGLLTEIADLMGDLEEVISSKEPVDAAREG